MNTISFFRIACLLLIAGTLTACVETVTEADEPEQPNTSTIYDLTILTRYYEIVGSCDRDGEGEFQFRYALEGEGIKHERETDGYGSIRGEMYPRQAGATLNFPNRTYEWKGFETQPAIKVTTAGTEWDIANRDNDMQDRVGTKDIPFEIGTNDRTITIGADSSCQYRLHYRATGGERQVIE
ncbi:MAG: hypothetical protein AAGI08_10680 [Bacteroidota bacterium]